MKFIWLRRARKFGLSYRSIFTIIGLSLLSTATEIFGIGMFLPIFQYIRLEGDVNTLVETSIIWVYILKAFTYVDISPSLAKLLLITFLFFIGRQILTFVRAMYSAKLTQKLVHKQRNILFDKYMHVKASFYESLPVGNLTSVIITEVQSAVSGVMSPMELIVYMIMLSGYIATLSLLSWEMTLASIIVLITASILPRVWIKGSEKTGYSLVKANMAMTEFLIERLKSPRLVRLSGTEEAEKKEFETLTLAQRKYQIISTFLHSKTEVTVEPFVIAFSLLFLYFSYSFLHLQIEVIGLYLVIIMRIVPIVKTTLLSIQSLKSKYGSIKIFEDRLNSMSDSKEKDAGVRDINKLKHHISINKVGYCYPESDKRVLNDVTFTIKSGEMTAVVGPSGSGKSTLIDLIPRLRHPVKGVIKIDGKNYKEYKLKSIRRLIAYAPQTPHIFNGTIKNHILQGKKDATNREIQEAVRLSGSEKFINQLPGGLETIIGEEAIRLSGGQRQRIDLARALVRKAPILILDEPTSNLDAESEEAFKTVLNKIHKETDTTIIIVSHRLASITHADQIIVLNNGMVENTAKHGELLEKKGWYAKAWKVQMSTIN